MNNELYESAFDCSNKKTILEKINNFISIREFDYLGNFSPSNWSDNPQWILALFSYIFSDLNFGLEIGTVDLKSFMPNKRYLFNLPKIEIISIFEKYNFIFFLNQNIFDSKKENIVYNKTAYQYSFVSEDSKIIIGLHSNSLEVVYCNNDNQKTNNIIKSISNDLIEIANKLLEPVIESTIPQMYGITLSSGRFGLSNLNTKKFEFESDEIMLKSYPKVDMSLIKDFFIDKKSKGKLLLLHGPPGSGKTTLLRYVLTNFVNFQRKIVLTNSNFFSRLESPEMTNFILESLKDSYLLIEDAENLLIQREKSDKNPIGTLLNYTDGIFGDSINMKVIATFNTNIENIDTALLRTGRLHHNQFIGNLTKQQAFELASLIKVDSNSVLQYFENQSKSDIALCDLYGLKK